MSMRATLAAVLFAASLGPALADNVTATVSGWDAGSRTLTLQDQSQFVGIPAKIAMPQGLKAGDRISIEFEGSENGVDDIISVQRVQ